MDLEDQQRFHVEAIEERDGPAIALDCARCRLTTGWQARFDLALTLAELNQRADEHAEVCR